MGFTSVVDAIGGREAERRLAGWRVRVWVLAADGEAGIVRHGLKLGAVIGLREMPGTLTAATGTVSTTLALDRACVPAPTRPSSRARSPALSPEGSLVRSFSMLASLSVTM